MTGKTNLQKAYIAATFGKQGHRVFEKEQVTQAVLIQVCLMIQ